ncbi:MAG TPA: adenylyltransferase/cytidyltransferase family protein, partial [Vicinamibacteria bacterium]|nr:adenylyltransferase/cytidyltransferase family protein [Vicinamibacteria bacterium]
MDAPRAVKTYRTGVVVGKFDPPHRGHHFLIETASGCCERLVVMVARRPGEPLPAEVRAACLREVHP